MPLRLKLADYNYSKICCKMCPDLKLKFYENKWFRFFVDEVMKK